MKDEVILSIVLMLKDMGHNTENIKEKLYILLKDVTILRSETALSLRNDDLNERLLKNFLAVKMVKGCTQKTIEAYGKVLRQIFKKIGKSCCDISTNDIRVYSAIRLTQDGISRVTANTELLYLRTFFAWLTTEEIIAKNPMLKIESIKVTKKKKKAFTDMECEKLRSACDTTMEKAIIEVLLSTGCRVSELCAMKIEEIKDGKIVVHGKGNKDRITYLNAKSVLALKQYLLQRKDSNPYIFPAGKSAASDSPSKVNRKWFMDPSLVGVGMRDKSGIEQTVRKIGRRAGVENTHPHRFRRTCATLALRRGMPIELVSKMLGHEQLSTTQIYLDIRDEDLEAAHRRYVV
ncbi:MAG: tyrosine-type recombinase/integrase [Acutalibacteraceae bacterium]|nr:tyrosine-type recombinase/integrase [Acutalibacteraceae bacterium]